MNRGNGSRATRVLVAARLSRISEPGQPSRIERDDEAAQKWAAGQDGVEVVATSVDAGISGATSPWKRPGLGKWLTDPALIVQYDEIVASSLDRLSRSARDLADLRIWAEDHDKRLRILSPALVWPGEPGDFSSSIVWAVLGELAKIERQTTSKRYSDLQNHLKEKGSLAGRPPWGFIVVGDRYNKTLAPDPAKVKYLRGMVKRALRGDTYSSIARWLELEGVETVQGKKWVQNTVSGILHSPSLKGRRLDAQGKVELKHEGIMSSAEWNELQAALDTRPNRRGKITAETALLTGIIFCEGCGSPMYRHRGATKRKDGTKPAPWVAYRCNETNHAPSQCRNNVVLADIEEWLDLWFTGFGPFAKTEIVEQVVIPGDEHVAEIAELEAEIKELDFDSSDYDKRLKDLLAERARLKALPAEPGKVIEHPTGITVGNVWQGLDDQAKRNYLMSAGVKVRVLSNQDLRATPGAEIRYIEGDPHKIIGTLAGITEKGTISTELPPFWAAAEAADVAAARALIEKQAADKKRTRQPSRRRR
jgi:site-specific DNA recombinase